MKRPTSKSTFHSISLSTKWRLTESTFRRSTLACLSSLNGPTSKPESTSRDVPNSSPKNRVGNRSSSDLRRPTPSLFGGTNRTSSFFTARDRCSLNTEMFSTRQSRRNRDSSESGFRSGQDRASTITGSTNLRSITFKRVSPSAMIPSHLAEPYSRTVSNASTRRWTVSGADTDARSRFSVVRLAQTLAKSFTSPITQQSSTRTCISALTTWPQFLGCFSLFSVWDVAGFSFTDTWDPRRDRVSFWIGFGWLGIDDSGRGAPTQIPPRCDATARWLSIRQWLLCEVKKKPFSKRVKLSETDFWCQKNISEKMCLTLYLKVMFLKFLWIAFKTHIKYVPWSNYNNNWA